MIRPESIHGDQQYIGQRLIGGRAPERRSAGDSRQHQPRKPHTLILTGKKLATRAARNLSRPKRLPKRRSQLARRHRRLKIQCNVAETFHDLGMVRGDVVFFSRVFYEIVQLRRVTVYGRAQMAFRSALPLNEMKFPFRFPNREQPPAAVIEEFMFRRWSFTLQEGDE